MYIKSYIFVTFLCVLAVQIKNIYIAKLVSILLMQVNIILHVELEIYNKTVSLT